MRVKVESFIMILFSILFFGFVNGGVETQRSGNFISLVLYISTESNKTKLFIIVYPNYILNHLISTIYDSLFNLRLYYVWRMLSVIVF